MDTFTKLIEALTKIAWPGIVIAVVIMFRPAVSGIIESARSRKFTLKIGGQELTMEEANEQQRGLIVDLQTQLVELQKRVESTAVPTAQAFVTHSEPTTHSPISVLWVDDYPKNNSYFIQQLTDLGIKVDLALSTAEGIAMFSRRKYTYILSDMGRHEDGTDHTDAGLNLLKIIRAKDTQVPFIIFCSSRRVREYKDDALRLGATAITSSATELSGLLSLDELKAEA